MHVTTDRHSGFAWFSQVVMAGALCRMIKVSSPGQVFAQ